jgi:hypothetical protein
MGKSTRVKSSHVRFGKRTFFFDVNLAKNDAKYLKITESRFVEGGKDRIYNSFILFPESVKEFQKNLEEMAGFLS